jgi:hypothetical protein
MSFNAQFRSIVLISAGIALPACLGDDTEPSKPEAAAPGLPTVTADGWMHYNNTLVDKIELINPTTTTTVGARDAEGHCVIASEGNVEGDSSTFFFEEDIAFNPNTCEKQTVRASINATTAAQLDGLASGAEAPADQLHQSATAPDAPETIATTLPWHAYVKTAWIDPVNITITSLADDIQWNRQLAMSSEVNNYKFRYDGWTVTPGTPPINWSSGSGWKATSTHDTFRNVDFERIIVALFGPAGFAACHFNFHPAVFTHSLTATGRTNGVFVSHFSDTANGGCVNLVHHRAWSGFGYMH